MLLRKTAERRLSSNLFGQTDSALLPFDDDGGRNGESSAVEIVHSKPPVGRRVDWNSAAETQRPTHPRRRRDLLQEFPFEGRAHQVTVSSAAAAKITQRAS